MRHAASIVVFVGLLGVLAWVGRDYLLKAPNPHAEQNRKMHEEYERVRAAQEFREAARKEELLVTKEMASEFVAKARVAERTPDPLARCLAYPDLPGNQWPQGLAKAHCEFLFGPHADLAWIRARIDAGDYAGLERRFAQDLEAHFAVGVRSEAIHRDFDAFDGGEDSERLSAKWLRHSPENPFALAARGVHARTRAALARGTKMAENTTQTEFEEMGQQAARAAGDLEKAIAAEPRLMPAYVALLDVAIMTSDGELEAKTKQRALETDPGCFRVASTVMRSLQPRWGGSEGEMRAFATRLRPLQAERPLLVLSLVQPDMDLADRLRWDGKKQEAWRIYRAVARASTLETPAEFLSDYDYHASLTEWDGVVYAVEAARFVEACSFCTLSRRGKRLLNTEIDLDWARESLEAALQHRSKDAGTIYSLGTVARLQERWDDANRLFRPLLQDPGSRSWGIMGLADVAIDSGHYDEARRLFAQLEAEFPAEGTTRPFLIERRHKLNQAEAAAVTKSQ